MHTPKEIIEQCILRWTVADEEGEFERGELTHWIEAAETIKNEIEAEGL